MAGGLVALLDDVAAITKLAAASLDDVAGAAGRAGAKAAGVVIDDTAVTPRYVVGLSPDRELPIIMKIAIITGTDHAEEVVEITDPKALEDRRVGGAIRTDFILSAEIMVIALADLPEESLTMQAIVLAAVGIAITVGVYGIVALIVKMDDIGLHLAQRSASGTRAVGRALVKAMPVLLEMLATIGTAAMIWVGGGIIVHGLEVFGLEMIPHLVHGASDWAGNATPVIPALVEWITSAAGSALVGLTVGGSIIAFMHRMPKKGPKTQPG